MRRMTLWLSLFVALVLAVVGAVPVAGQVGQLGEPSSMPDGLSLAGWQSIQDQLAKLVATDGASQDFFGDSVSVDGDIAVVGAVWADVGGHSHQGAAYVFYRDPGGAWSQVAKLTAADGAAGDVFGGSVSISGETAIVGANWAHGNGHLYEGAAYVFERNQGGPDSWGQVAKLVAADGEEGYHFGISVAVDGDTAVVGAYQSGVGAGAAYIFGRDQGGPNAWGQVAKLTAADGADGDEFGISVSLDSDTAVVGADFANASHFEQGVAYVFYRNQGGADMWGQVAKLVAADGGESDLFGGSVSVDGDTAVVGATCADVGSNHDQGAAYVFYRSQGGPDVSLATLGTEQQWVQVAKLTAADGASYDDLGQSVAVGGDTAVVGAPDADPAGYTGQGAAYVYYRNQGGADVWGQVDELTADDGAAYDFFGCSVSLTGGTPLIGARGATVGNNESQGAAYVYSLPTTLLLHLNRLQLSWRPGSEPGTYVVTAVVRVHDQDDARAGGVTVSANWRLPTHRTAYKTEVTERNGLAEFRLRVVFTGRYRFCITDLAKTEYGYAPGANEVPACKRITVGP